MSRASLTFLSSWYSRSCRAMSCLACFRAASSSDSLTLASVMASSLRRLASVMAASREALWPFRPLVSAWSQLMFRFISEISVFVPCRSVSGFPACVCSSSYLIRYMLSASAGLWLAISSYCALTSAMVPSMSGERLLSMDSTTDVSGIWDRSSWISSSYSCLRKLISSVGSSSYSSAAKGSEEGRNSRSLLFCGAARHLQHFNKPPALFFRQPGSSPRLIRRKKSLCRAEFQHFQ
ncbi:uncharacterized protein LOC104650944 [Saimiri boliviensis]|uniref:uncharacterized protein LOC104650944 n=1 Tax=Saimiri boliviensis TaxID=27679 RepID=UPI003D789012